jgi:allantoin racemase
VKILLFNPNMTAAMTDRMVKVATQVADPATELVPRTATHGVAYIASSADLARASEVVLETLPQHQAGFDATVIAAFGDPGLLTARQRCKRPVVGMAEAAMLTACMLGRRFSIISFAPGYIPMFSDLVRLYGLDGRFAGVRVPDVGFSSVVDVQDELEEALAALALRAVHEDGADVIIPGGAPLAGLAGRIKDRMPVPIVDPISAAVLQAEALVHLLDASRRPG